MGIKSQIILCCIFWATVHTNGCKDQGAEEEARVVKKVKETGLGSLTERERKTTLNPLFARADKVVDCVIRKGILEGVASLTEWEAKLYHGLLEGVKKSGWHQDEKCEQNLKDLETLADTKLTTESPVKAKKRKCDIDKVTQPTRKRKGPLMNSERPPKAVTRYQQLSTPRLRFAPHVDAVANPPPMTQQMECEYTKRTHPTRKRTRKGKAISNLQKEEDTEALTDKEGTTKSDDKAKKAAKQAIADKKKYKKQLRILEIGRENPEVLNPEELEKFNRYSKNRAKKNEQRLRILQAGRNNPESLNPKEKKKLEKYLYTDKMSSKRRAERRKQNINEIKRIENKVEQQGHGSLTEREVDTLARRDKERKRLRKYKE